jgi:putative polyhydroxyalkanoate system protein
MDPAKGARASLLPREQSWDRFRWMPTIRYEHRHALDNEAAHQRIRDSIGRFSHKYRFNARWERQDHAVVSGPGFRGTVDLPHGQVVFTLDISFMLSPLRSRIESEIAKEMERALS